MSPPTKLLLGSVVVFFAMAGSGIDIDRVVQERPVITFLLRALVILCLAGAAVAVVWWPFSFRARRKRAKADRQAAIKAQAAVDWVVSCHGTVQGATAIGLVDLTTGTDRWLVEAPSNRGSAPAVGTQVAAIGEPGALVSIIRRAALESEDDQIGDEPAWFARDLTQVEAFDAEPHVRADAGGGGSVPPTWPTA